MQHAAALALLATAAVWLALRWNDFFRALTASPSDPPPALNPARLCLDLHLDYATSPATVREVVAAVLADHADWDGLGWRVQVVGNTSSSVVVRVLVGTVSPAAVPGLAADVRAALSGTLMQRLSTTSDAP